MRDRAMAEEKPPLVHLKSSNWDARVSCETISQHDLNRPQEFDGGNRHPVRGDTRWKAEQPLQGPKGKSQGGSKGLLSASHLFACLPPANVMYIVPNPAISPARDVRRGDSSGKAWPHAGPIAHSGSVTRASPNEYKNGPIKRNAASLKNQCVVAKRLSALTIIPADFLGKKKPLGYESDEPTSPVVTCIGRVRMKHKHCKPWSRPSAEKYPCEMNGKRVKKIIIETPEKDKYSGWTQESGKLGSAQEESNFHKVGIDLNRFSFAYEMSISRTNGELSNSLNETGGSCGDESRKGADCREANGGLDQVNSQIPPPNSLLLMRGRRNSERQRHEPQALCPVSLTKKVSHTVERQFRRALTHLTALDVKKSVELELKETRKA